jgi:hypothetical protein
MTRSILPMLLAAIALVLTGCAGSPSKSSNSSTTTTAAQIPSIAGAWEFKLESSSGTLTGIEVALQEGTMLSNGVYMPDGSISASGTQMAFVTLSSTTGLAAGFGGYCPAGSGSANTLSGAITALDNAISNFTFTENGNAFNVTATLSGDGKSMLGTYQSASGSACPDSGTFTGSTVSKLSGTYAGNLTLPSCTANGCDLATATLSESSSGAATLSLVLTGTNQGSLTLTGPVTGNAFAVQGTLEGQTVVLDGYYELSYNTLDQQYDLPTLYVVNATTPTQAAGLLTVPQT